jgi:hypothetical protein
MVSYSMVTHRHLASQSAADGQSGRTSSGKIVRPLAAGLLACAGLF